MLQPLHPKFLKKNPIFGNFLLASTLSLTGSSVFEISMPLYVLIKTQSVMALSLVSVAMHLPHFITAPLTGFLADHYNKRRLLLACDIGQILMMLSVLVYHFSGSTLLWPLLIMIFVNRSLQNQFETISNFQLVPGLVSERDLPTANTWFLSFHRLIQIVGPFLGGMLMHVFGAEMCIGVNILSFSATLFFTYKLKNLDQIIDGASKEPKAALTAANMFQNFRSNLLYVYHSPLFKPFVLLMFLWNLSSLTLNSPTLTYYFNGLHHFTPAEYGVVVSAFGVLGILGFLISERLYRVYGFNAAFYQSAIFQAVLGTLTIFCIPFPLYFAAFYSLSRTASSVMSMGTFILRQTEVPKRQAGGVNAVLRMFFMSAAPLSSLIQGFIMTHINVETSLVLGALCLWAAAWHAKRLSSAYKGKHPLQHAA